MVGIGICYDDIKMADCIKNVVGLTERFSLEYIGAALINFTKANMNLEFGIFLKTIFN